MTTPIRANEIDAECAELLADLGSAESPELLRNGFRNYFLVPRRAAEQLLAERSKGKHKPVDPTPVIVREAVLWASQAWEALYDCLTARQPVEQRPPLYSKSTSVQFIRVYSRLYLMEKAHTFLKHHTSWIFARCTQQSELPALPQGWEEYNQAAGVAHPIEGAITGGWAYHRLHGLARRDRSFDPIASSEDLERFKAAQDILYLKVGCPVVPKELIEAATDAHREALCDAGRHEPRDPGVLEEQEGERALVRKEIKALCRTVFRDWSVDDINLLPSQNAAFGSSRINGGGSGFLQRVVARRVVTRNETSASPPPVGTPIPIEECEAAAERDKVVPRPALPSWRGLTVLPGDRSVFESRHEAVRAAEAVVREFQDEVDYHISCGQSGYVVDSGLLIPVVEPVCANPYPIPEPLKVRMITMGEAPEYYRALALQQSWWKRIKVYSPFRYTGRVITDSDWDDFWNQWEFERGTRFVSGDYEASTDNLNPELSRYVVKRIFKGYRAKELSALERLQNPSDSVLDQIESIRRERHHLELLAVRSTLLHRLMRGVHGDLAVNAPYRDALQSWGQLMGSPCSFPVLNIINLCATASALRVPVGRLLGPREGAPRWVPDRPVLCNGDDIAFSYYFDQEYERWKKVVSACGLKPSLGKNYTSEFFCQINSQCRLMRPKFFWVDTPGRTPQDRPPYYDPPFFPHGAEETPWHRPTTLPLKRLVRAIKRESARFGEPTVWERNQGQVQDLTSLFSDVPLEAEDWVAERHHPYVPFVNLALLRGFERKGQDAGKDVKPFLTYQDCGERCQQLVSGFSGKERDHLILQFVHYHREVLSRCPGGFSWYSPPVLGGAGMPRPSGIPFDEGHLRVCAYISGLPVEERSGLQISFNQSDDINRNAMRAGRSFMGLPEPRIVEVYRSSAWNRSFVPSSVRSSTVGLLGLILTLRSADWHAAVVEVPGKRKPRIIDYQPESPPDARRLARQIRDLRRVGGCGVLQVKQLLADVEKRRRDKTVLGWQKEILSGSRGLCQKLARKALCYAGNPMSVTRAERFAGFQYVEEEAFDETELFSKNSRVFAATAPQSERPLADPSRAHRWAQRMEEGDLGAANEVTSYSVEFARFHPSGCAVTVRSLCPNGPDFRLPHGSLVGREW